MKLLFKLIALYSINIGISIKATRVLSIIFVKKGSTCIFYCMLLTCFLHTFCKLKQSKFFVHGYLYDNAQSADNIVFCLNEYLKFVQILRISIYSFLTQRNFFLMTRRINMDLAYIILMSYSSFVNSNYFFMSLSRPKLFFSFYDLCRSVKRIMVMNVFLRLFYLMRRPLTNDCYT